MESAIERPRLLVVEDDLDSGESLAALLRQNGYEVVLAASEDEALAAVRSFHPLGVMLDLGLPDLATGLRLAARLRSLYGSTLVLIAVTGHVDATSADAAMRAGVDYVLGKPIDLKRLDQIVPPLHG